MLLRSDFSSAPVWFQWGLHEIGVKETPGNKSNARILEYRKLAGLENLTGDDGIIPWCKIFVNAAFRVNGFPIRANAMARSIEHDPSFIQLKQPCLGAVASFWRISKNSGSGHIGFYRGETPTHIYCLDGNTGDDVSIGPLPRSTATFGLVGYYWPVSFPVPPLGAIPIRAGDPLFVPRVT